MKEDVSYVFFSNENCLYGTKLGLLVKLKESVLDLFVYLQWTIFPSFEALKLLSWLSLSYSPRAVFRSSCMAWISSR